MLQIVNDNFFLLYLISTQKLYLNWIRFIKSCSIFPLHDYSNLLSFLPTIVVVADSSITAAAVVLTGLVGANFVKAVLDKLRFQDPIARGVATASRYARNF